MIPLIEGLLQWILMEYLPAFAVVSVAFAVADITDEQMAEGKRRAEEWQPT